MHRPQHAPLEQPLRGCHERDGRNWTVVKNLPCAPVFRYTKLGHALRHTTTKSRPNTIWVSVVRKSQIPTKTSCTRRPYNYV